MTYDFGYPWWLTYAHLPLAAIFAVITAASLYWGWDRWKTALLGAIVLWALSAFCVMRFGVALNAAPELPTEAFLKRGEGKVLDLGAGTGRSSIMVLRARPRTTLVASDLFGDSFEEHFGEQPSPQALLAANLKKAGVDGRASIATADMRALPFEDASYDAVVTAFAIDHLRRDESVKALGEVRRVLKPGGEFLMMVVNGDAGLLRFAFGPLLAHGGFRGSDWWTTKVKEAGFEVRETGEQLPAYFVLARKPL